MPVRTAEFSPIPGVPLNGPFDRGLALALNLFLFALPLAAITAVREITLGLAVFFWLAAMVWQRRLLILRTPLDLPLLALVAMALLSLVWAVNPAYSFKEIRGELLKGLLVFYLAVYALQTTERLQQTWLVLLAGNLLLLGYAFWDFHQAGGILTDYYIRARSLHSGYGTFGTYLITVFPYLLVLLLGAPLDRLKKIGVLALAAGTAGCIYITFGRAMWLAAGLELLLVAGLLKKKKVLLLLLVLGIAAAAALPRTVRFHGERLPAAADGVTQNLGGTGGDLIAIWKLAGRHILENPFRGIGFGRHSFSEAFTDFRARHQPLLWHAHNTLLNITFQTGIQGLLALLWVVAVVLHQTLRPPGQGSPSPWAGLFSLATGVMVCGFLVRNFFDDFFVDDNALLFWFLLGGALGNIKYEHRTSNIQHRTSNSGLVI
jgi:O-antigen ligase